jgi:biopolymer transport protein ExbD
LTKEDSVAISADKLITYEDFIFVIDVLKQNHVEKITMVVKP